MLSVVIPTHNRCELLLRAIKSVQNQTYKELEIIVVSDGSEDRTSELVEELKKSDSRIVFHEYHPSMGGNYARNAGIALAKGEYIGFLDDDDIWMKDKIEKQLHKICETRSGLCFTGSKIVYEQEGISYYNIPKTDVFENAQEKILIENFIGTTSTVIVQRDVLLKSNGFDEKLQALQDYDLWIRICQLTKICAVPEPLIIYNNNATTQQVSSSTEKYEKAFEEIEKKYENIINDLTKNEKNSHLIQKYSLLAKKCMRNGNPQGARQYATQMLKMKCYKTALEYICASFVPYHIMVRLKANKSHLKYN